MQETLQKGILSAANQLSCATSLMLLLIRFKCDLDDKNADALRSYLSPNVVDTPDQVLYPYPLCPWLLVVVSHA